MNLDHLSTALSSLGPALKNHLWQSTVFLLFAALVALCMQKNHARVRFWIWLTASIKFLIPFSILVTLGTTLAPSRKPASAEMSVYNLMYEVSQPFTSAQAPNAVHLVTNTTSVHDLTWLQTYPILLATIWVIGFLSVLMLWGVYWRRVSHEIRAAIAADEGPELSALQCFEQSGIVNTPVQLLLSDSTLGPGIYGITRPILIWPSRILHRLNETEIKSIVAHEVCHVRHRDNLTAAIHMLVQAIFWFHPLVWWIGSRLELERERACDELVLKLTGAPQAYAESILKVCEFCLESPLPCVAGVTGADLKKRIARIMNASLGERLSSGRKALLAAGVVVAVVAPIILGQATASQSVNLPRFEVASIKLWDPHVRKPQIMVYPSGRVSISHATLDDLIAIAFRVHFFQISGGAKWTGNLYYDIEAKAPEDAQWKMAPRYGFNSIEDERLCEMLQALLIDRFQLKFHRATKTGDVYLMERRGKSLKLSPTKAFSAKEDPSTAGDRGWTGIGPTDRGWVLFDVSMQQLADFASVHNLYKPVYDRTGLMGRYDYSSPEGDMTGNTYQNDPTGALFDLIQDIGLKLVSAKGPVDTFVIDHAEPPSPN